MPAMAPIPVSPAPAPDPAQFQLDDLLIDGARQQVRRGAELLPVQGLSWQLLWCLVVARGEVVGFDTLMARVWAPALVNEETITQRVKLLRQALGDDGRQPRYVRSVRGRGYQLCQCPRPVPEPMVSTLGAPRWRRSRVWAITAGVALAVAISGWYGGWWRSGDVAVDAALPPLLARARWYAGIGQLDDNRRAVALYREWLARPSAEPGLREEAETGLSHALSAQVCQFNQPFAAAEEALRIADQVLARRPDAATAHAARAYALDCLGRIDGAMAAYRQAIALDPAGRQDAEASLAHLLQVRGQLADALAVNAKLVGAGSTLRLVPLQLARTLELLGETAAAEARLREQFTLLPDHPFVNLAWPQFLARHGRIDAARAALTEAMSRPRHAQLHVLAGELALQAGDQTAAAAAFATAASTKPASWPQTLALVHGLTPLAPAALSARIAAVEQALAQTDHWPDSAIELAVLELAQHDTPAALAALRLAVAAGFRDQAWLATTPLFAPLAGDPGFDAVLALIATQRDLERARIAADPALAHWLVQ